MACNIIAHDLERDDIPPCSIDDDGIVTFPTVPADAPTEFSRNRLFVVHMDFQRNTACLRSALWVLHGIKALVLDGTTTHLKTRQDIVHRWRNRELDQGVPIRVLILTSVGRTGINLAAGDRLLLMVRLPRACGWDARSYDLPLCRTCSGLPRTSIKSSPAFIVSPKRKLCMCTTSLCETRRTNSW